MKAKAKIKLKAIQFDVDFRYSEFTIYQEFKKNKSFPGELGASEAFLFVSRSGNQLLWVLNVTKIDAKSSQQTLIDTRRWRLSGSTWHPFMLQNYAAEVGLELIGIRRFEAIHQSGYN